MRKWMSILLGVLMISSVVLTACTKEPASPGAQDTPQTNEAPKESANAAKVNPPGQFPIVNEKITLKVMVRGNSLVEDFKTNATTKWMEEKTNIHIDWIVADEKNYQEQLNLALSSGDLPDIIMNMEVKPEQQMVYGEQGIFISLTDLIEKWGVNAKKVFQEMPEAKDAVTAPGNKIYSLPLINECYHCSMNFKMYVYKPWLDKLGLQEPTTLDEYYEMLKAFKEKDPNGNGKADEIPLVGAVGSRTLIDPFIMNSFIYDDGMKRMVVKDGKIDVVYNKPEWRDGLRYLNKLYKEGLIASQTFTQDDASLKKIAENPDIAIAGAMPAHSPSTITIVEGPSGRWLEYQPIAPLKGPSGKQLSFWNPFDKVRGGQFVITSANKHPEASLRWADQMYEFEAALRLNFGSEGSSWEWAKQGDLGRDGQPAKYRLLIPFGRVQNESWAQYGLQYRTDRDYYAGQYVAKQPDKEKMYYDLTKAKYSPHIPNINTLVPPLFFPTEDSAVLAELDKTINDHVKSMTARFINGDANIETEWDKYVQALEQMNLKKYLEIYQKAYDAKMKK